MQVDGYKHPVKCHPTDNLKCAMILEKDEKALFPGLIQTPLVAAEIQAQLEQWPKRMQAGVLFERQVQTSSIATLKKMHAIDLEAEKQKTKLVEKFSVVPWYERPIVVIPITAVLTYCFLHAAKKLP